MRNGQRRISLFVVGRRMVLPEPASLCAGVVYQGLGGHSAAAATLNCLVEAGTDRDGRRATPVPFFLVAALLTPVILWFVTHGSGATVRDATFAQRLAGAGAIIWFYLSKALVPIGLLFVYPQWHIGIRELLWWVPLMVAVIVTAVLAQQFFWQRTTRGPCCSRGDFFAWHCCLCSVLPTRAMRGIRWWPTIISTSR